MHLFYTYVHTEHLCSAPLPLFCCCSLGVLVGRGGTEGSKMQRPTTSWFFLEMVENNLYQGVRMIQILVFAAKTETSWPSRYPSLLSVNLQDFYKYFQWSSRLMSAWTASNPRCLYFFRLARLRLFWYWQPPNTKTN
jgi:hypothetical protein